MDKRINRSELYQADDQTVAEQLRREALESRPQFSESLHRRILRSVVNGQAEGAPIAVDSRGAGRRRRGLAILLTAACLLAAVAVGWRFGRDGKQPDAAKISSNDQLANAFLTGRIEDLPTISALTDRAIADLDGLLAASGFKLPSSQMEHDARLATDALLRRIPFEMEAAEQR
ncbi:MAG: hypothetical protein JW959_00960 [Pirellulales bacterium]|nr:hypothetical protein [Pirellulales bacterium]